MKKVIAIFLIALIIFCCVACDDDTPKQTLDDLDTEQSPNVNKEQSDDEENDECHHKEIELNLDNYKTYLDWKSKPGKNNYGQQISNAVQTISGVLSIAYYENVSVTFEAEYRYVPEDPTTYAEFTINLNAAGNAEFETADFINGYNPRWNSYFKIEIKEVTGKVIFTP
ncbi:MAG: hypothetical protein J6Q82_07380 [Clostridia bacterium]|nr:hypothetical protein [Clostridia bacterium]